MKLPHIAKAAGLGAAALVLSAGAALAAVATTTVNVRMGPGTGYHVVDTLYPGERVSIVGQAGGWCAVEKSGPNGWVACRYLADSVRFRDNVGPNVSLSFGFSVRPDRPRRHHHPMWWDDHPMGPRDSIGLSLVY